MIGLLYFVFSLGLIVVVHELGHLVVAKRNNVHCYEFSVGMGPKIKHFYTDQTGTKYMLRAIPLGGYVMLAGEDQNQAMDSELEADKLLDNKTPWVRFKVLVAGSLMNFLLAVVLLFSVSFFGGVYDYNSTKISVSDNYPAAEVGLVNGSEVVKVDGVEVFVFDDITKALENASATTTFELSDGSSYDITFDEDGLIGIAPYTMRFRLLRSLKDATLQLAALIFGVFYSFFLLFGPEYGVNDLSGPIGIYSMSSDIISFGISTALVWIAFLSANIGLVNLFPIPALDGGRLVFVFYEMVTKKRPSAKLEETALVLGVFLLLGLTVIVSFNDILKLFN